ncbi:GNAT family N-acetyltransferase [Streptomyces beijiangensis]|uniref:GNAT family N-acetyltransferase n=1 Tax=Streptomyces beijiangensis TaxID=163361 RepID=A0A939F9V6_9ACTN|nr:GNAT family N-acetyltransferase [Streptomyces beijiangensis]MBO0515301.1 GNAT family N-acetyltransferase [Streptomyces beijiangensis]
MTYSAAGELDIARATPEEWQAIVAWAAAEGWNPGLDDIESFFAQDPEGFFTGRVDGELVSAVSVVNYSPDYAFLGFYLVHPDHRGRGHGLATWKTALAHAGSRTVGLDGVPAQQDNYRRSGFGLAHGTVRYVGTVPAGTPAHIEPAAATDRQVLLAYDSACYPADRPAFLDHWLTQPGHRALARVVDGRLTGYGVIRPAREAHRIGPLFADTEADARALLAALAAEAQGAPVAMDVPESNPEAVAMAVSLGLEPTFATARMYTGPVRPVAGHRVYGVTTLELG